MPIFEYTCDQCRTDCELLIRGEDKPICPECGSSKLTKQLSVPAAHVADGGQLPLADLPPCGQGGCGRPQCDI